MKVFSKLIEDLKKRDRKGRKEYGKSLKIFDNRVSLQDAYDEALDLAVYIKKELMERAIKIIAVDIDGTLAQGISWTPQECLKAKPVRKMIKKVNKLYQDHFIVIYTARRHFLYEATIKWLKKNSVKYHAVRFEKMPASIYLDDRAINSKVGVNVNRFL